VLARKPRERWKRKGEGDATTEVERVERGGKSEGGSDHRLQHREKITNEKNRIGEMRLVDTQSEWQYENSSLCSGGFRYRNAECLDHIQSTRTDVAPISKKPIWNNGTYFNKRMFFLGDSICKEFSSAFSCEMDLSIPTPSTLSSRGGVECSTFSAARFSICYHKFFTLKEDHVDMYKREFAIADYVVIHFGMHYKHEGTLKDVIVRIIGMISNRSFIVWLSHGAQHFNTVGGIYQATVGGKTQAGKNFTQCAGTNVSISEVERVDWRYRIDQDIPWKKYNISVIDWWKLSVFSTQFHSQYIMKASGAILDCTHWCHSRAGIPYIWVQGLSTIIERNEKGYVLKVPGWPAIAAGF